MSVSIIQSPVSSSNNTVTLYNKSIWKFKRDPDDTYSAYDVNTKYITVSDSSIYTVGQQIYFPADDTSATVISLINATTVFLGIPNSIANTGEIYFVGNWWLHLLFKNSTTGETVAQGDFVPDSKFIVEIDANSYIQNFQAREHIVGNDYNHSLDYKLSYTEYFDGVAEPTQSTISTVVIEGLVQLGQDVHYEDYIYDEIIPGTFLQTPGCHIFQDLSSLDYVFSSHFDNADITRWIIQINNGIPSANTLDFVTDNVLIRQILEDLPATLQPGWFVDIWLGDVSLGGGFWNKYRLTVPCEKGVSCRWINDRGAYNYYRFANSSEAQSTEDRQTIPIFDEQILQSGIHNIYSDEQSYDVIGFETITVQERTDNFELMRSLLNTSTLEILGEDKNWYGYTVQDGSIPINAKNRTNFIYDFEFRKTRR